ncbi:MAG: hypothetical protein ACR2QK_15360, partial [Acidimicrobiales bacterium]
RLLVRIPWIGPRAMYRLQRAGGGLSEKGWPEIVRDATRLRPEVVSVDVFDTCLVRDLVGDEAIEHVIEHRRADRGIGSDGAEGPKLDETGESARADEADEADQAERELCRPVPGVAEALEQVRRADAKVVFVSDTDRSSRLLTNILESHDLYVDGDRLVASCEAGSTKSDGRLYDDTFGDRGSRSSAHGSVWHVGNHLWADVTMAATAGLRPIPMIEADANRYEHAMAARADGYGPAVAGAARLARLRIEEARRAGTIETQRARVQTLGADVAGQTMAAFVLWVAEQCRAEGIEHLAFLARDGELPYEVARALPPDHWQGRSLRYLHCSRLTWSLAAASVLGVERWIADGTGDDEAFLLAKRHDVPFSALLARIGLTAADVAGDPDHRWLAGLDSDKALPVEAVTDWESLLADRAVHQQIAVRADDRLKLIVDRLRQEGTPAGKFGLVDVGWRGRLASQVSAVLAQVVGQDPVHFHFGGENILPDVEATVPIRRFAFDGISDPDPILTPVSCIETLTASGKPRVIEYRRNSDGEVDLVFDEPPAGRLGDRTELWAGALRMAELMPSRATLQDWGLDPGSLADEAKAVLDHWWNRPSGDEVEALADLTFEHDEAGTSLRPLVTPYRPSEMRPNRPSSVRQWPQGSAVASGRFMRTVAWMVQISRSARRRLDR